MWYLIATVIKGSSLFAVYHQEPDFDLAENMSKVSDVNEMLVFDNQFRIVAIDDEFPPEERVDFSSSQRGKA